MRDPVPQEGYAPRYPREDPAQLGGGWALLVRRRESLVREDCALMYSRGDRVLRRSVSDRERGTAQGRMGDQGRGTDQGRQVG